MTKPKMAQHKRLAIALISAVILGAVFHHYFNVPIVKTININLLQPVGQIFLRLIFMVVVPLVFSALVLGVYELGKTKGLGRVASKTLMYTFVITTISVGIGVTMVNVIGPGRGFELTAERQEIIAQSSKSVAVLKEKVDATKTFSQSVAELIPKNPLDSAVRALDGEMLPFMVFTLIFGTALSMVSRNNGNEKNALVTFIEQIFAVCMKIIDYAMVIAPFGVFAIVFNTIFNFGLGILLSLFLYVVTVVAALLIQQFIVYTGLLKFVARRSPWEFFKSCRDVYVYAFSTSSSNVTLPKAIDTAENKLGIPSRIARFVLTVGATANQNGTAIFEGVTVLFLAQVYGIELSLQHQVYVVVMAIIAGIGSAGIPSGSLPLIMLLLQTVGIPPEGIGLILGVDRFLDMCRTTINVSGDLVIAALVSNEKAPAGQFEETILHDPLAE